MWGDRSNCCPCSAPARRACQFLLLQRTRQLTQRVWMVTGNWLPSSLGMVLQPSWSYYEPHILQQKHSLLETPRANAEWYLQTVQKTARVKQMWSLCNCCSWQALLEKSININMLYRIGGQSYSDFPEKRLHEGFLTVLRYHIATKNGCWCDSSGSA